MEMHFFVANELFSSAAENAAVFGQFRTIMKLNRANAIFSNCCPSAHRRYAPYHHQPTNYCAWFLPKEKMIFSARAYEQTMTNRLIDEIAENHLLIAESFKTGNFVIRPQLAFEHKGSY